MLSLLSDPLIWITVVVVVVIVCAIVDTRAYLRATHHDPTTVCVESTLYSTRGRDVQATPIHPPIKDPVA